jgi:fumarate reductase flavoprotein subunit
MYQELHGVPLFCDVAHPMAQGHGIAMGVAAGGYLRGGEKYLCTFGSVLKDRRFPSAIEVGVVFYPRLRQPWEICVNQKGARFVREDHPSVDHREKALLAQPGHRHFAVFDQEILDVAPPLAPAWPREKFLAAFNAHPMFMSAPTLPELAAKMGADIATLVKTVDDYNAAYDSGADKLGRTHMPLPIVKPPFYAVAIQGYTVKSCAGLAVDPSLRVIKPNGGAVAGLYAVGEVIGGGATSGDSFVNGMMVTPAITFGRLLGQKILPG